MDNQVAVVKIEQQAMTVQEMTSQVRTIQEYMNSVMKKDEHYGVIPGTAKPSLLKPGAEKLCLAFRLDPNYEIIREMREKDFIAYTVKCTLYHIPTSQEVASGVGSCNSRETKYRYRSQNTGKPVPEEYWKNRNPEILGGVQYSVRKKDKNWYIFEQIENENPWDLDNTLIKMACKRALVAATLNATAASDIFTQDIEDMPVEIINAEIKDIKPEIPPQTHKKGPTSDAETKRRIDYISTCKEKNPEATYGLLKAFELLGDTGGLLANKVAKLSKVEMDKLEKDLEKELGKQ